ncbi:MAG: hypothetical protein QM698_04445 [Micropepsaceae bacterium]
MKALLAAALLLAAAPLAHADPEGDLKTLCDRLCGGVWVQSGDPAENSSDAMSLSYTYTWDEELHAIRGVRHVSGGVAGLDERSMVVIGETEDHALWIIEAYGSRSPAIGDIKLTENGYTATLDYKGRDQKENETIVFTGPNAYSHNFELISGASVTKGMETTYTR